jgi:hypothetical protein
MQVCFLLFLSHLPYMFLLIYVKISYKLGHAVAQLVKTLHYKPEGRGLDFR